jgi:hypothetical protein
MTHVHVGSGLWRGARRLATSSGSLHRTHAAHGHILVLSSPCAFERVGVGSQSRFFSASSSSSGPNDTSVDALVDSLDHAARAVVRDVDLLNAVGPVASNGAGDAAAGSSLAIVQAVQTLIENVHTTTGLPWWATLAVTGVTFRAAVFPFYLYQLKATQR